MALIYIVYVGSMLYKHMFKDHMQLDKKIEKLNEFRKPLSAWQKAICDILLSNFNKITILMSIEVILQFGYSIVWSLKASSPFHWTIWLTFFFLKLIPMIFALPNTLIFCCHCADPKSCVSLVSKISAMLSFGFISIYYK